MKTEAEIRTTGMQALIAALGLVEGQRSIQRILPPVGAAPSPRWPSPRRCLQHTRPSKQPCHPRTPLYYSLSPWEKAGVRAAGLI